MSVREMSAQDLLEHLYRGSSIGPGAPVKVSAQETPDLAPTSEIEQAGRCDMQSAAPPVVESMAEPMIEPMLETAASKRPAPSSPVATPQGMKASHRIALALSVAMVGLTAVNAFNNTSTPDRPTPSPTTSLQMAEPQEIPATIAAEVGKPVLFKNPFDETEVFEFPHGTSKEEARAAVADMLLKRAMERQSQPRR